MERGASHPASGVHEIKRPLWRDRMARERDGLTQRVDRERMVKSLWFILARKVLICPDYIVCLLFCLSNVFLLETKMVRQGVLH